MSDLAFNMNGEPFELLPTMAAWRVRKLKPKGAPEVVYGRDGLPLFLPPDADIEDLRRDTRSDGRYRLDQVDEQNRPVPNAQSAYVCVHPIERLPEPPTPAPPAAAAQADITAALVAALLESQKQHTELARMYVSQFPVVANAMAGVVRSASDAGLTARVPLVVPALSEAKPDESRDQDDESDDDDEDLEDLEDELHEEDAVEVAPEPKYSWARVGQTFADHVGPYVGPLLAGVPGLASLLGAHGTAKTAATPGPGPSDPAPAGSDGPPPSGPVPGLDAAMLVRLQQITAQLTPAEEQFARSLLREIAPEDMPSWIAQLRAMSIPEAVAYVRDLFRQARAAAGETEANQPSARRAPAAPRRPAPSGTSSVSSGSLANARRAPSGTKPANRPASPTPAGDGAALRDAGTQAHLDMIERALGADERTAMRKHFAGLSSAERARFVAGLLMLPVPDAVAAIRARLSAAPASPAPAGAAPAGAAPTSSANRDAQLTSSTPAATPLSRTVIKPSRATRPNAAPCDAAPPTAPAAPAPVSAVSPEAIGSTAEPTLDAAPATVERTAHTHLAEVENSLTPEERGLVHTMITTLSPDDRDAWLDRLLSMSVTDGAAMLRDAIQTPTAAGDQDPVAGHELDAGDDLDDGTDPDDDDPNGGDEPIQQDERHSKRRDPTGASVPEVTAAPHDTPQPRATLAMPAIATSAELPMLDAESLAHFQAIEDALTLAEKMRAHELAAQRPAAELRRWYADLVALSVPDAVAKIRAELARNESGSPSTTKGGAS